MCWRTGAWSCRSRVVGSESTPQPPQPTTPGPCHSRVGDQTPLRKIPDRTPIFRSPTRVYRSVWVPGKQREFPSYTKPSCLALLSAEAWKAKAGSVFPSPMTDWITSCGRGQFSRGQLVLLAAPQLSRSRVFLTVPLFVRLEFPGAGPGKPSCTWHIATGLE
jgi:hypothetical protein